MKKLLVLGVLALLQACASTPTVHTDSDPAASFAGYRTFKWIQPPEGAPPLVAQRIVAGVDAQLRAKGWTASEDADVAIAAHVASEQRQDVDTFYSGPAYVGWGWRGAWGVGSVNTTTRHYTVGTLVVDMFDARTRQAVWRGSAEGTVPGSPEQLDAKVQAGIDSMFADFPPNR